MHALSYPHMICLTRQMRHDSSFSGPSSTSSNLSTAIFVIIASTLRIHRFVRRCSHSGCKFLFVHKHSIKIKELTNNNYCIWAECIRKRLKEKVKRKWQCNTMRKEKRWKERLWMKISNIYLLCWIPRFEHHNWIAEDGVTQVCLDH